MKKQIDLIISFGIYGIGLLSFLILDIIITKNFTANAVANWAFYKSTVIIIGSFTLLGYDQVLLRDPRLIKTHFRNFVKYAVLISLVSSLIIYFIKDFDWKNVLWIMLGVLFYGIINYNTAASRANNKLWQSQFSKNFWKLFLLLLIVFGFFENVFFNFVLAFLLTFIISIFIKGYFFEDSSFDFKRISSTKAKGLSQAFLITSLTLLFAVYGEQFIINLIGDVNASAHLFRYVAIITPISLSINGFLGFYLGPRIIRDKSSIEVASYKSIFWKIALFSLAITMISMIVGTLFLVFYLNIEFYDLDFLLICVLSCTCFIRGIYVTNSAYLGVYAERYYLIKIAKYFGSFTVLYLIFIAIVLFFFSGIIVAQIISLFSLINWLLRFIISHIYIHRILNKNSFAK